jgi:3-oxoacyl-[acyl-carrier-protein] synthase-3
MKFQHVRFHGFGYELPPNVITSDAIEERLTPVYEKLKLPKGRLELMSGIKERRFWDKGTRPSDAAVLAGKKAIAASGIPASDLECLIFTSVSRDMMEPATATFVHNQLGLPERCLVFDISNACLGFPSGINHKKLRGRQQPDPQDNQIFFCFIYYRFRSCCPGYDQ